MITQSAASADAVARSPVRFSLPRGARLDEPLLHELWTFRAAIMNLKPEVDREVDFAAFCRFCRASERVMVLRDGGGRVAGMIAAKVQRFPEERVVVVVTEYAIFAPAARGSTMASLAYVAMLGKLVRASDWRSRWYLAAVGYPASVLAAARLAEQLWIDGEPGIPPFERGLLERFAAEIAGPRLDPVTRLIRMPTRPPPLNPHLQKHPAYPRYVARNPGWQDGVGLAVLLSVESPRFLVGSFLGTVVRRARRRVTRSGEVATMSPDARA